MRKLFIFVCGLSAACTHEVELLPPLPEIQGGLSHWMAEIAPGERLRMRAAEERATLQGRVLTDPEDAVELVFTAFDCTLEELGLIPGLVSVPLERASMPEPLSTFRLRPMTEDSWVPIDDIPTGIKESLGAEFLPRAECPAFQLESTEFSFPTSSEPVEHVAEPIHADDGTILIVTTERLVSIFPNGVITAKPLPPAPTERTATWVGGALWYTDGGQLVERDGRTIEIPLVNVTERSDLSGGLVEGEPEFFYASASRTDLNKLSELEIHIYQSTSNSWTSLETSINDVSDYARVEVEWLGPGHAIVGFQNQLIIFEDYREVSRVAVHGTVRSIQPTEAHGLLIGLSPGGLSRLSLDERQITEVRETFTIPVVYSIVETPKGLIFGGGTAHFIIEGDPDCSIDLAGPDVWWIPMTERRTALVAPTITIGNATSLTINFLDEVPPEACDIAPASGR